MAPTSRERNMIIGIVAVVVIAAIVIAFLLGRGCGGEEKTAGVGTTTAVAATSPTVPVAGTSTQASAAPSTTVEVPATPEPSPAPTPEPVPTPSTLEITERSVTPPVAHVGEPLTFTAKVKGEATKVVMSGSKTDGTGQFDFILTKGSTAGGVTTWAFTTSASSLTGVYRYFARAFATDGTVVEMPGVSAWTFEIIP